MKLEVGPKNPDVVVTCLQFNKPNQPHLKLIVKQTLPKYSELSN